MKRNLTIIVFVIFFILPFSTELSYSQSINQNQFQNIKTEKTKLTPQIDSTYLKVSQITGWDIEIAEYFVDEARNRNVSVFGEALPIIHKETGGTYDFGLVHYNTNGTYDKGAFQINDITYIDIVRLLKQEGREFKSWSRLNPRFNISGGLCWISYLKSKGLEGHSLFSSFNRGVTGARNYASRNGTYETKYSRDIKKIKEKLKECKYNIDTTR